MNNPLNGRTTQRWEIDRKGQTLTACIFIADFEVTHEDLNRFYALPWVHDLKAIDDKPLTFEITVKSNESLGREEGKDPLESLILEGFKKAKRLK